MKHFILSTFFITFCCIAFSQTKKADSAKKITTPNNSKASLVQEKIWPTSTTAIKNKDGKIIIPGPAIKTRIKL